MSFYVADIFIRHAMQIPGLPESLLPVQFDPCRGFNYSCLNRISDVLLWSRLLHRHRAVNWEFGSGFGSQPRGLTRDSKAKTKLSYNLFKSQKKRKNPIYTVHSMN